MAAHYFGNSCDSVISSISNFSEPISDIFEGFTDAQNIDFGEYRKSLHYPAPEVNELRNFTSEMLLEDISELRTKCEQLQKQMEHLTHLQEESENKIAKQKTEYAVLKTNYVLLEEQKYDLEMQAQKRLKEEKLHYKELMKRKERETLLEFESYELKIKSMEVEMKCLKDELKRERLKNEQEQREFFQDHDKLDDIFEAPNIIFPNNSKSEKEHFLEEEMSLLNLKLERLEMQTENDRFENETLEKSMEALRDELKISKEENLKLLKENEDLQVAVMSKSIVEGQSYLNGNLDSLAFELNSNKESEVENDLRRQLKDQKDANFQLKKYLDSVLLKIVEHSPQFLEIK